MSLEDAINALTKAVEANTKALGGAGGTKSTGGTTKAADKKKGPTLDAVAKRYGAYMSAEGDDGKAMVRKVVKHFDVKKISELEEGQFEEALSLLDQIEAGDDPFSGGDDDLM